MKPADPRTDKAIRTSTIVTGSIVIKRKKPFRQPRVEGRIAKRIRELQKEVHHLARAQEKTEHRFDRLKASQNEMQTEINELATTQTALEQEVSALSTTVQQLETEIETGITPFPGLQDLLQSAINQVATISTPGGTVSGTVVEVGTDAVLLQESTGDLLVVPFAKITTVQV
ncbi:hypothetical protein [Alicyclobacillus fodiniaquatilis]|jgi:chromosome segregation ATPase|uniref:DUF2642 domain-containing protein n=1 Tax=Alicyclobacillus fodiniaquatilis TaxID=1661150 RepID=A0ABW4JMF7_9BACL